MKPTRQASTRFDLSTAAHRIEQARKRNPSLAPPTAGKRIDPNSPEGMAIAQRYGKPVETR